MCRTFAHLFHCRCFRLAEPNMSRDSPTTRADLERWPSRSEAGSASYSPYGASSSSSYPLTPSSGLRPAEPGAFSTETWNTRGDPAKVTGAEVGPAGQPPSLMRPIKRPSSPDYWTSQPSSRQKAFGTQSGWTGQVTVPQPGLVPQGPDM